MIETIVAALALSTPVTCTWNQPAWETVTARHEIAGNSNAFYLPASGGGPKIVLGPNACWPLRELTRRTCIRSFTTYGVVILAHELEHALQERQHRPLDEEQAERVGRLRAPAMLRRLERAFGIRCR